MGAREILAYRDQAVMSAKQFIELWLEECPKDDPHDAALVLADLVKTYRTCIYMPNTSPKFDYVNDDVAAARNKLQAATIAGLHTMAAERRGVDAIPMVSLSREALLKAFEKIGIRAPRFLYPPSPTDAPVPTAGLGPAGAPSVHPRASELASGLCSHSNDFRTAVWYRENFRFSDQQSLAVGALWHEWEKGDLGLAQGTLREVVRSSSNRFQLRNIFRVSGTGNQMHPAWGRMIHSTGKGLFKLGPPS